MINRLPIFLRATFLYPSSWVKYLNTQAERLAMTEPRYSSIIQSGWSYNLYEFNEAETLFPAQLITPLTYSTVKFAATDLRDTEHVRHRRYNK